LAGEPGAGGRLGRPARLPADARPAGARPADRSGRGRGGRHGDRVAYPGVDRRGDVAVPYAAGNVRGTDASLGCAGRERGYRLACAGAGRVGGDLRRNRVSRGASAGVWVLGDGADLRADAHAVCVHACRADHPGRGAGVWLDPPALQHDSRYCHALSVQLHPAGVEHRNWRRSAALAAKPGATVMIAPHVDARRGEIHTLTLHSRALSRPMTVQVVTPPDPVDGLPVLYFLHPWGLSPRYILEKLRLPEHLWAGVVRGVLAPFVVALPEGGKSFYVNALDPPGHDWSAIVESAPSFYEGALEQYGRYGDYLWGEVMPAVEERFGVRRDRAGR